MNYLASQMRNSFSTYHSNSTNNWHWWWSKLLSS